MNRKFYWVILAIAGFITWGCMTFRYVGNGFSLALIAFGIAVGLLFVTRNYQPKLSIPLNLRNAFIALYGTLFIVGGLQNNILQNLILGSYSALNIFLVTVPLWMILYIGRKVDIRKVSSFVIIGNLYAFCIYGFWLYFTEKQERFSSFYGSPPEVGMLLDLLLPFSIAIGVYYWNSPKWRIAILCLVPFEITSLILTETRGSYLAISGSLFFTAIVWLKRNHDKISDRIKLIVVGFISCVCIGLVGYAFSIGMESTARMVGGERLLMWESSYHMWRDHPVLGIGLDGWRSAYNDPDSIYFMEQKKETTNMMPHNIYIFFLATGGLVSFCGLVAYILFMLRYLCQTINLHEKNPIAWGMFFIFIAFMAHGMVDGTLISRHIGRIFYLLMGIGILFIENEEKDLLAE